MKDLWMNPVVLGAGGVIVVGFALLVLAVRALLKPSTLNQQPATDFEFPTLRTPEPLSVVSPDSNPFSVNRATPAAAPVVNKDVLDKVDLISQRLVDMQMLLNKQVATSANPGAAANAGLSPEMLDKLLKITSTVAQQIDILQKALGGETAASPVATAPSVAAPAVAAPIPVKLADAPSVVVPPAVAPARPAPAMTPVSQVVGSSTKTPPPPATP